MASSRRSPKKAARPTRRLGVRAGAEPASRAYDAVDAMIRRGQARDLAASATGTIASSSGLGDVIAQVLQAYVLHKAKAPEKITRETADHLMDMHKGVVDGVTRLHEVVSNSPLLTPARDVDSGRPVKAEIIEPDAVGAVVRETRLTVASRMFDEEASKF